MNGSRWRQGDAEGGAVIANEYAAVRVSPDHLANGIRLRLTDLRSGQTVWLDPMALESLIWSAVRGRLAPALETDVHDPRWSVQPGAEADG